MRRTNCHPVESDEDTTPESISDTEDLLTWNGDTDGPNDSEDDCAAEVESDIKPDSSIEDLESPGQLDASTAATVSRLIGPTWKSMGHADKVSVTVNAIVISGNKGVKKQ
jgi:hypothetical protein